MTGASKAVLLLAISAALTLSHSNVVAKTLGPSQVKTSGKSAAPAGSGGRQSKTTICYPHHCITVRSPPRPGHTQPPCRGPHKGPNGVMI